MLITNSHYGNIWPISAMAMGGLIGNVLFFVVSGFCLYEIKVPFHKWYVKRVMRIYPALWIVNIFGVLIGFHKINSITQFMRLFLYPTYYHFIASIMFLYIIYYFLMYLKSKTSLSIRKMMLILFGIYVAVYLFLYDKSFYHIDVVEEPMVRFLYLEGMLLGVFFRENMNSSQMKADEKYKDLIKIMISFVIYVTSKVVFSTYKEFAGFQILNQIIIFVLVYYLARIFVRWENNKTKSLNQLKCGRYIKAVSQMTLEIYFVQYMIFYLMPEIVFPLNFIVVTSMIILGASIVKRINSRIKLFFA